MSPDGPATSRSTPTIPAGNPLGSGRDVRVHTRPSVEKYETARGSPSARWNGPTATNPLSNAASATSANALGREPGSQVAPSCETTTPKPLPTQPATTT